jgi:hypothetical protein
MTLIETFGQLLKYESHRLFHRDASVLVNCTQAEWEAFQKAAADPAAPVELAAVATRVIEGANVTPKPGDSQSVSVQLPAGGYHALGEAHEAAGGTKAAPAETKAPEGETKAPADPQQPPDNGTGAETKGTPSPNEPIA